MASYYFYDGSKRFEIVSNVFKFTDDLENDQYQSHHRFVKILCHNLSHDTILQLFGFKLGNTILKFTAVSVLDRKQISWTATRWQMHRLTSNLGTEWQTQTLFEAKNTVKSNIQNTILTLSFHI